jgi:hypothetical protein
VDFIRRELERFVDTLLVVLRDSLAPWPWLNLLFTAAIFLQSNE